jgi:hypothetical protein
VRILIVNLIFTMCLWFILYFAKIKKQKAESAEKRVYIKNEYDYSFSFFQNKVV